MCEMCSELLDHHGEFCIVLIETLPHPYTCLQSASSAQLSIKTRCVYIFFSFYSLLWKRWRSCFIRWQLQRTGWRWGCAGSRFVRVYMLRKSTTSSTEIIFQVAPLSYVRVHHRGHLRWFGFTFTKLYIKFDQSEKGPRSTDNQL